MVLPDNVRMINRRSIYLVDTGESYYCHHTLATAFLEVPRRH